MNRDSHSVFMPQTLGGLLEAASDGRLATVQDTLRDFKFQAACAAAGAGNLDVVFSLLRKRTDLEAWVQWLRNTSHASLFKRNPPISAWSAILDRLAISGDVGTYCVGRDAITAVFPAIAVFYGDYDVVKWFASDVHWTRRAKDIRGCFGRTVGRLQLNTSSILEFALCSKRDVTMLLEWFHDIDDVPHDAFNMAFASLDAVALRYLTAKRRHVWTKAVPCFYMKRVVSCLDGHGDDAAKAKDTMAAVRDAFAAFRAEEGAPKGVPWPLWLCAVTSMHVSSLRTLLNIWPVPVATLVKHWPKFASMTGREYHWIRAFLRHIGYHFSKPVTVTSSTAWRMLAVQRAARAAILALRLARTFTQVANLAMPGKRRRFQLRRAFFSHC